MSRFFSVSVSGVGSFVTSSPMRVFTHAVVVDRGGEVVLDGFRMSEALAVAGVRSVQVRWANRGEQQWPISVLPVQEITRAEYAAHVAFVVASGVTDSRKMSRVA